MKNYPVGDDLVSLKAGKTPLGILEIKALALPPMHMSEGMFSCIFLVK